MDRRRWSMGLTSLLALGVIAWCFSSPSEAALTTPDGGELAPPPPPPARPRAPQKPPPPAAPAHIAEEADEQHIGMPSHPLTPEHQRIFRENNLVAELNGAMDVADVAGLRERLQQYRDEYPEDAHVLQDGYELIANCLEHPSPETRAVAQRYYDEELASGLRRYIRRHCL